MNQSRICTVHIGAPKTGTTYLQRFLFDNRATLLQRSLHYPDVSLRGFGHHDLAFLLAGGYPDWATPQQRPLQALAEELREQVARHDAQQLLISSENFWLLPAPGPLLGLLESTGIRARYRIRILVYLRPQDQALESWYNQTVKAQGATHEFAQCLRESRGIWDYERNLERWAGVFGAENIVVRTFEASRFAGGSLLGDFRAVLGIAQEDCAAPAQNINTALNRDLLEFQRLLNALPMPVQDKRHFHRELMELSASARGSGMFSEEPVIGPAQRREILAQYRAGNDAVAARYLQRDTLFDESPAQGGEPAPVALTPAKLLAIFRWIAGARGD